MSDISTRTDSIDATGSPQLRPHFTGFEALRALAAAMVVVHHASSLVGPGRSSRLLTVASVADSGVAVFFVMSGFLLWRPMVAASLSGRRPVRIGAFWWRRILRIVPAYWMALSIFWAAGAFDLGENWWRYYLFLQIYRVDTVLGGIVPAWSLSTEMSFYLVLPFIGLGIHQISKRVGSMASAVHVGLCGFLWVGGFVARYIVDHRFPLKRGLAFEWLPQNLDLFATGMGLATVSVIVAGHQGLRARVERWTGVTALWWSAALALFLWYAYRVGPTSFEVGYTGWFWHQRQLVLAVVTTLLLVPVVFGPAGHGPIRRFLELRPIVWVGLVSYGLYLWHLDLMHWAVGHGWFGLAKMPDNTVGTSIWAMVLIGGGLGLIAAALSWYGLERPLQRFNRLFGSSTPSMPKDANPAR